MPSLFLSSHGERPDNRVHGAKPNAYVSLRKPGGNGILGESGPSSSYFLDNPEKKEITSISGNPFRFTGVPNRIPFDFAQGKFTGVAPLKERGVLDQQNKRDQECSTDLCKKTQWRPQPDLNRCCRRERPMSWTWLDDGDADIQSYYRHTIKLVNT